MAVLSADGLWDDLAKQPTASKPNWFDRLESCDDGVQCTVAVDSELELNPCELLDVELLAELKTRRILPISRTSADSDDESITLAAVFVRSCDRMHLASILQRFQQALLFEYRTIPYKISIEIAGATHFSLHPRGPSDSLRALCGAEQDFSSARVRFHMFDHSFVVDATGQVFTRKTAGSWYHAGRLELPHGHELIAGALSCRGGTLLLATIAATSEKHCALWIAKVIPPHASGNAISLQRVEMAPGDEACLGVISAMASSVTDGGEAAADGTGALPCTVWLCNAARGTILQATLTTAEGVSESEGGVASVLTRLEAVFEMDAGDGVISSIARDVSDRLWCGLMCSGKV